ncbi:MAG: hypothetical protein M1834_005430 [Cirrosporium novae-zelandiae]|nr:MAG: hypothetical protein M1834_005430 [Cirrosporium novae-zelandiae]
MHSLSIISLALAASSMLVNAYPSGASLARRDLAADEIIVWGSNGRVEVMNKTEYYNELASSNITIGRPESGNTTTTTTSSNTTSSLVRRSCKSRTVIKELDDEEFLNWDVAMSSVVHATDESASVSVTEGYSISNTLSVSVSASLTIVEDFLSTTFGVDYSESWSSSYTSSYTFTVPAGKYGVVVSNPQTIRHSGYVYTGCVGAMTEEAYYQGDSYTSKAYGGLSWVEGTISLCTGTTYPVPRCIGSGSLS